MAECIAERTRHDGRPANEVWHWARPRRGSWWRGIQCSETEGICLPGHGVEREPTCPDCLALLTTEGRSDG